MNEITGLYRRSALSLDIGKGGKRTVIEAKQYDCATRFLEISLYDGDEPYDIADGVSAQIRATKPDGTVVIDDCTVENGLVIAEISGEMLTRAGRVCADIALRYNGQLLSAFPFCIDVAEGGYKEGAIESRDDVGDIITKLQTSADNSIAQMESIIANFEPIDEVVKARGDYGKLADRLDVSDRRMDNIIANSGNVESNSELIDIRVGANANTYDSAGSAVRAIGTGEGIIDGAISQNKLSFIDFEIGANHLKTDERVDLIHSSGTYYRFYYPIYIEAGKTYRARCAAGGLSAIGIFIVDDPTEKNPDRTALVTVLNWTEFQSSGVTFTVGEDVPSGWHYFIVAQATNQNIAQQYRERWMVSEGEGTPDYEDYYQGYYLRDGALTLESKDLSSGCVSPQNTDFIGVYNAIPVWSVSGYWVNPHTGLWDAYAGQMGTKAYYAVNGGRCYYCNKEVFIVEFDEELNYLTYEKLSDSTAGTRIVRMHDDARYVRFSKADDVNTDDFVFIQSVCPVSYEQAMRLMIDPDYLLVNERSTFSGCNFVTDGDSLNAMGLWQPYLEEVMDFTLLKNCAVGGATVAACAADNRIAEIPKDTQYYMMLAGTNDYAQSVPLGSMSSPVGDGTFYGSYKNWLEKVIARIPTAHIFVMIPPYRVGEGEKNAQGHTLDDYRAAIKAVAAYYGVQIIDLRGRMGVSDLTEVQSGRYTYTSDGVHYATDEGNYRFARCVMWTVGGVCSDNGYRVKLA